MWFLFWFSFDSLQINEIFDQIDSEYVCCYVVTSRLLTASTIINDQSIMQIIALFFSLKFLDSCTGLNDFELFKCTNQTPYSIHTHTHTHTALISFYSLVIFSFVCYLLKLYFSCFEWNNNCIYRRRRHKLVRLVCDPVCIIDQIK